LKTRQEGLFDADIFYEEGNYYLSGKEIEKRGENEYYSPSASFTTCDAPVPDWCVQGKMLILCWENVCGRMVHRSG